MNNVFSYPNFNDGFLQNNLDPFDNYNQPPPIKEQPPPIMSDILNRTDAIHLILKNDSNPFGFIPVKNKMIEYR